MNNKDLQLLAQRFAEETAKSSNDKKFAEMFSLKVLQWMGETFAMVSKDFLCEYYNSQQKEAKQYSSDVNGLTTIQRGICQVRMGTMIVLFGKELFNPDKQ